MQRRKVTYKLYPSTVQAERLLALLRSHKDLWNAALEERIDAWRKARVAISYEGQCASLTQIRRAMPDDWANMNCSSQQLTLRRLDLAFEASFARCARGGNPGFPRFKSLGRLRGFGFKGHGDGWRFTPKLANGGRPDDFGALRWGKHGSLRLQGIGHIKCRGQARSAGVPKSCDLLYLRGQWNLSVTLECAEVDVARSRSLNHAMAADWGLKTLLAIVRTDGVAEGTHREAVETVDNPRWYKTAKERLVALDRAASSKRHGSTNWRKVCARRGAFRSRLKRRRHDFQHQLSASLASRCAVFATEKLSIKNMTGSGAGTLEEPGRLVRLKAGLNREILDTAPAALFQKIAYKVSETGGLFLEVPTGRLKASQTCPSCGALTRKSLAQRRHRCGQCGHEEDRDVAAARVMLRWALGTLSMECGQELTEAA